MKIWLDDERPRPDNSWLHCHSVNEVLTLLTHLEVEAIEAMSLDHDLGVYAPEGGDGYQVVLWMAREEKWPQVVNVHSANTVARERMLGVIDRYGPYGEKTTLPGLGMPRSARKR